EASFSHVSASRGYYKARALRAQEPKGLVGDAPPRIPRKNMVQIASHTLQLRAYGLTFGAARLDPGTRLLLESLMPYHAKYFGPDTVGVDLGCGNGTIATFLARCTAVGHLIATDDSASAVRSTAATLAANNVDGVHVMHQSGLVQLCYASFDVAVMSVSLCDATAIAFVTALFLFAQSSCSLASCAVVATALKGSPVSREPLHHSEGASPQTAGERRFIV